MLKLQRFTFHDHSVLWLEGSRRDIAGLLRAIKGHQRDEDRKIPIGDLVEIENPDGLRLHVVSHEAQPIESGEFHWPCLRTPGIDSTSIKLTRLVDSRSLDESFDLWPVPAQLLIESVQDVA
jgi:hypothetical protein